MTRVAEPLISIAKAGPCVGLFGRPARGGVWVSGDDLGQRANCENGWGASSVNVALDRHETLGPITERAVINCEPMKRPEDDVASVRPYIDALRDHALRAAKTGRVAVN